SHEQLVHRVVETRMPTDFGGEWRLIIFANQVDEFQHVALVKGEIDPEKPVLVRVHSECLTGDCFGISALRGVGTLLRPGDRGVVAAGDGGLGPHSLFRRDRRLFAGSRRGGVRRMSDAPLLACLRCPDRLAGAPPMWVETALRQARRAGLLPWLAFRVGEEARGRLVGAVADQLLAARILAEERRRMTAWEMNRVRRALEGTGIEVILLKGAAYVLADLPVAAGRLPADVDLLLREADLPRAEAALKAHGWGETKADPYDQRYYREWMHELPPLRHHRRLSEVDLHRALLPLTGRLRFDPEPLWGESQPVAGVPEWRVLSPRDMTLHAVIHLFFDSDMALGLRELVVVDGLLRYFGREEGFWPALTARAEALGVVRPLAYALRLSVELLETPVPEAWRGWGEASGWVAWWMGRALRPAAPDVSDAWGAMARRVLFLRGHWVRMPPWLLARHVMVKGRRRWLTHGQIR
ncbi:MAG: nucleotidyltransferase family protein, partial [Magnetococcales bacterium]|nr:nucleotidyltransferase family protein [Magnetococcales bacterium]